MSGIAAAPTPAALLVFVPLLPLMMAAALLPRSWRPTVIAFAPWAALPALAAVTVCNGTFVDLPWLLLGARLGLDDTGQVFLFFTAVLWFIAGSYSRHYLKTDENPARYFAFYLLAMAGNLGLIVAEDALSFYLFFALMSFSSYGLIVHRRSADALRAGRVYIVLVVLGEVLMFAGFLTAAWQAGTVYIDAMAASVRSDAVIALLVAGFAIKAGALPLHVWLPLAHPVAPVPASAVLSGAMIKAGLLGWLRFLPLGHIALPEWSAFFISAGLAAAVFGVVVGLLQDQSKTVLAYSSISQMGFMTVCVGIGMAAPDAWPMCLSAVLLYALHHAFAKGALFLSVGVAAAAGKDTVQRWLVGSGLSFAAMALAGLPMTSGAAAKSALSSLSGYLWPNGFSLLLSALAIGTTLLMARFLYLVWPRGKHASRIAAGLWIPWAFALLAVALCTLLWPQNHAPAPHSLSLAAIWHALWPGVTGATIALAVLWQNRMSPIRLSLRIPAGDILWLMSQLSIPTGQVWSGLVNHLRHFIGRLESYGNRAFRRVAALDPAWSAEAQFHRWAVSGVAFLCLLLAVFLALAFSAVG